MVVREHDPLIGLHEDDERDLMRFALAQPADDGGQRPAVLLMRNRRLYAQNYVGIIETRRGTEIEILPKIDLSPDGDGDTRRIFMTMLRNWRGLGTMRHYDAVMPWVGLFLFGHGLATFSGPHVSRALLFPMEEVFEDFVTAAVRRHQQRFAVRAQGPKRHLAIDGVNRPAFGLKPDITLMERGQVRFILDAKWKRLDPSEPNHGVSQADAYQLFAYGRRYGCRRVVLVYPRTAEFRKTVRFRFAGEDDLELACFPFDVSDAMASVHKITRTLSRSATIRDPTARRA